MTALCIVIFFAVVILINLLMIYDLEVENHEQKGHEEL